LSDGYWSKRLRDRWFYILLGFSALAVVWIFWAYLFVLLYAGVTVVCCWPAYKLILRATGGRAWLASGLTTLALALLVFVPLGVVLWLFALEVQEVSQTLIEMVQSGEMSRQIDTLLQGFEVPDWLATYVPELPELLSFEPLPPPAPPDGLAVIAGQGATLAMELFGHPLLSATAAQGTTAVADAWVAGRLAEIEAAGPIDGWSDLMGRLSVVEEQFTAGLQDASLAALRFAGAELPGVVQAVVNLSIDSLFYVFGVVVLFVEGPALLTFFKRMLPVDERYADDVFDVFGEFSRNMVVGSVATSVIQGVVAGVAFAAVGLEKVVFLSILVFLGSFVPVVGTPVVWVPVVIYMIGVGDVGPAIGLGLWCLIVVGTIDNILRPLFMRGNSEMHTLLIFLAVFGGMYWMGLAGVLVGPIIVAIFLALYRIYVRDYLKVAPQPEASEPGFASRLIGRWLAGLGELLLGKGKGRTGNALVQFGEVLQHGRQGADLLTESEGADASGEPPPQEVSSDGADLAHARDASTQAHAGDASPETDATEEPPTEP